MRATRRTGVDRADRVRDPALALGYDRAVARRTFPVWTPDQGTIRLDPEGDDKRLRYYLQEVLDQGLWRQFCRFPPAVVARLLPGLVIPSHTRKLIGIWIEEKTRARAA